MFPVYTGTLDHFDPLSFSGRSYGDQMCIRTQIISRPEHHSPARDLFLEFTRRPYDLYRVRIRFEHTEAQGLMRDLQGKPPQQDERIFNSFHERVRTDGNHFNTGPSHDITFDLFSAF